MVRGGVVRRARWRAAEALAEVVAGAALQAMDGDEGDGLIVAAQVLAAGAEERVSAVERQVVVDENGGVGDGPLDDCEVRVTSCLPRAVGFQINK